MFGRSSRVCAIQYAVVWLAVFACFFPEPGSAQDATWPEDFDHFQTGFPLTGRHEQVSCDSCHVGGTFRGISNDCGVCHAGSGAAATTSKPPNHIPTGNNCDDCHTTSTWSSARFEHDQVGQNCFSCHNGVTAQGKSPGHIASGNGCGDCHNTVTWGGARFDHASITGNCFQCHNGVTATGKPSNHIQSGVNCEDCHTTVTWSGAVFDHQNISSGCQTCHNGTTATGKPSNHIPTGSSCEVCHSTVAWLPAGFDHAGVTGNCGSCHNGTTAAGKPAQHFVTALGCEMCHLTATWTPDIFDHTSPMYPGDHQGDPDCIECHQSNSQIATYTAAMFKPDCAGCHANDYKTGPHKKHENPDVKYTVSELRNCAGACHVYEDATLTTIKKARNGEHRVSDGDF